MGEYILSFRGKIMGGIYDNRLLARPVKSAIALLPTAPFALPYAGAKERLLVEKVNNKDRLRQLLLSMDEELSAPQKARPKKRQQNEPHRPIH